MNLCDGRKNTASTICNPCPYEYDCTKCKEESNKLEHSVSSMQVDNGSNAYRAKKDWLAVQSLDLFTKVFCIKENEEDLAFECKECVFRQEDRTCLVKMFASKRCPEYRNFGSMGEL